VVTHVGNLLVVHIAVFMVTVFSIEVVRVGIENAHAIELMGEQPAYIYTNEAIT
jgi:hypothetical protein